MTYIVHVHVIQIKFGFVLLHLHLQEFLPFAKIQFSRFFSAAFWDIHLNLVFECILTIYISSLSLILSSLTFFYRSYYTRVLVREICIWLFLMHVRSSSNAINFRQFLQELCPFSTLNYCEYAVFPHFFTICIAILSWNFDFLFMNPSLYQVRVLSICVNFCRSHAPFWTYNTGNVHFSACFCFILGYIELKFCIHYLS